MKREKYIVLFIGLIMFCFLCSCSTGKSNTASNIPAINCEYGYFNYVVPGEDGYYLLCNGLIGFWDGDIKHKATPLCKRPDCGHDTNECSGRVVGAESKMFYVDGNLYVFSFLGSNHPVTNASGFPLWKVAADGSSKEVVLTVKEFPNRYTIFEDMVYYEFQTENETGKIVSRVLCQPLSGGEEMQIWESSLQDGGLTLLQGIGDKVYFFENGLDMSIDMNAPDFDINEVELYRNMYTYEPESGTLITNPKFGEKEGDKVIIRNIYDGMMYYAYYDSEKEIENELWCRPVDGGEERCLGNMPPDTNIADSEYVYTFCLTEENPLVNMVRAYDYKGNLVQELEMPHKEGNLTWIPATEDYIFGFFRGQTSEGGRKWDTAIVVMERSKLKEGKAEMIRIFENEWS